MQNEALKTKGDLLLKVFPDPDSKSPEPTSTRKADVNKKISQLASKPQTLPKHNPKSCESTLENRRFNSIDAPKPCSPSHQLTIAREGLYFELEFALEPNLDVIERSLQILKEQHEADQVIVRRVIDLMIEAGAA